MSDLNLRVSVLRGVSESMYRLLVFTNPLVSCNRSLVYRRLIGEMFAISEEIRWEGCSELREAV